MTDWREWLYDEGRRLGVLTMNGVDARDWIKFDPLDIPRMFAQDEVFERGWSTGLNVPAHPMDADELAAYLVGCRDARLLPFGDQFVAFLDAQYMWACEEVSRRMYPEPHVWRDLPVAV